MYLCGCVLTCVRWCVHTCRHASGGDHVSSCVCVCGRVCMNIMNQFKALDMLWTPETMPRGWVVLNRTMRTREWGDLQRA